MQNKILITGATGNIGKLLIPSLLERGQSLRAFVRDERKVAYLGDRVERAVGDLDKPETLKPALEGVDRMFLVTVAPQQDIHAVEAAKRAAFQ